MNKETPNLDYSGFKNEYSRSEIEIIYKRYIEDPIKNSLLQEKYEILRRTIPGYVHNAQTNKLAPIYDPETKRRLDDIDRKLHAHIRREYDGVFTVIEATPKDGD